MKNILITGGAGFIGSYLTLTLIERGYNVTVLDCLSPQIHGDSPEISSELYNSIKDKANVIIGSVESKQDWRKALKDQDVVVHLAAETGTGQSMYQIQKYFDVNVNGTALLLDLLANEKNSIKKVVIASSRALYGEGKYKDKDGKFVYPAHRSDSNLSKGLFDLITPDGFNLELVPTDEDSKIHPSSIYGITKQVQEQMIFAVCPSIGVQPVSFRYQNVYGPGQSLKNPYTGILSIFSTQIKNENNINIFEDGKESRDFVYIDDVIKATILGIEKDEANNEIFNVGTGVATSVLDVAKTLVRHYNSNVNINVSGNYRVGDIRHNIADLSKIKKILGFEATVSFDNGIKEFVKWVNKQEIAEDLYSKSIAEMKDRGLYK